MNKLPYNQNLLPIGYFSRRSVPYWCIVALDSVGLVAAGVLSIYVFYGGLAVVLNFWTAVQIWMMALPLFLISMHFYRTYVGTLTETPARIFKRLVLALLMGGIVLSLFLLVVPFELDYKPGAYTIGLTILISLILQFGVRMVARVMFNGHEQESAEHIFFNMLGKGTFSDTAIRANKKINLCLAHMSEEGLEMKYVKEAFDTNWVVPLGPNVNAFEKELERFMNKTQVRSEEVGVRNEEVGVRSEELGVRNEEVGKQVVALSAGTAAVHLALRACGVLPGDEVIVQTFTFCASVNPIAYLGAVPVFVDSEPLTWNMDPVLLETAIKDRIAVTGKKPKAIVPVALYGMPYQVDKIMEVADRYDIPVVEDAAEGFGSEWNGRKLGTYGKFGVLSFNGNKMITTSGGGALVCEDESSKKNIMWYATQAREAYPYYQHEVIGYNYRLSNVCAGIGRGQMTVLDDHIAHHRKVQKLYEELLKDVPGVKVHKQPSNEELGVRSEEVVCDSNFWLCAITLDEDLRIKGQDKVYKQAITTAVGGAAGVIRLTDSATTDCQPNDNVEALRVYMDEKQIEARPVWKPMHKQPVYKEAPAYVNGVSEEIFKKGMCLPAGPCVSEEDVRYIVNCIRDAIES